MRVAGFPRGRNLRAKDPHAIDCVGPCFTGAARAAAPVDPTGAKDPHAGSLDPGTRGTRPLGPALKCSPIAVPTAMDRCRPCDSTRLPVDPRQFSAARAAGQQGSHSAIRRNGRVWVPCGRQREILRDPQAGGEAGEVPESRLGCAGDGVISVLVQLGEAASGLGWSHTACPEEPTSCVTPGVRRLEGMEAWGKIDPYTRPVRRSRPFQAWDGLLTGVVITHGRRC